MKRASPLWIIAVLFLSGCLPDADFKVAVEVLDEETGRPIPDAWVFVTARVQADPPFEAAYNKPLAGAMAKTDSKGIARLKKLTGFNRNEPEDVAWRAVEGAREARRGNPKRRISGIEGGNIAVLARGYGALARTFGIKDNPAYQEKLKDGRYEGIGRMGFKDPGEPIELSLKDARKGVSLTLKLGKPEPVYVAASYCPMVLVPMIWGPTSWKAGASQSEKRAVYQFILEGVASLGAKADEGCGHGRASDWASPQSEKDFMAHQLAEGNHDTVIHAWLTQKALEILPSGLEEVKQYATVILEGVKAEDEDRRFLNHFYNPLDPANAMSWGEPALKWGAIGHPDNPKNEWDWQDALRYYREGDTRKAYKALGHVLHLLEDLSVPMHTRVISHMPFENAAAFESHFGKLARQNLDSLPPQYSFPAKVPKPLASLQGHFEDMARMTFGLFEVEGIRIDFDGYYAWQKGGWGKQTKEPEEKVLDLMGQRLFPKAIEHAAGLMAGFYVALHPDQYAQAGGGQAPSGQEESTVGPRGGDEPDKFHKLTSDTDAHALAGQLTVSDPDDAVEKHLPRIERGSKRERAEAIRGLERELSLNYNRRSGRKALGQDKRTRLEKALIREYRRLSGKDVETEDLKEAIAEVLAARGKSDEARQFLFEIVEAEPEKVKRRILSRLGGPDGIPGDELYSKVDEWAQKGIIPKNSRPGFLARFGKKKAVPDILKIVDSTRDREEFFYASWALQDAGAIDELARVFKRAKELQLDKDFKGGANGLHWIETKSIENYVEKAQGGNLITILELLPSVPSVRSESLAPILVRKLRTSDPRIRELVCQRLAEYSENPRIDHDVLINALYETMNLESDPKAKAILEASLGKARRNKQRAQDFLKREAEWIQKNQP